MISTLILTLSPPRQLYIITTCFYKKKVFFGCHHELTRQKKGGY